MKRQETLIGKGANRRSFLKKGAFGAGAAAIAAGLLPGRLAGFGPTQGDSAPITKGDIAILTFLSALEQVEADLWIQYAELGGPTNAVPGAQGLSGIDLQLNGKQILTGLAPDYVIALQVLDGDMPQYIADNTDDEISHHRFLNNYLASKGAQPIDLSQFAILPPSRVTGVPQNGRLTNLKQLKVDTKWWTRYRSDAQNPDFGGSFENAVPDLARGQHPAIPLHDGDLVLNPDGTPSNHLQAIASTAGFHFAFIEQGGSSLYPSLAQRVTDPEVLRILLSIGPTETAHFQTWHDKAGNAPAVTDGSLVFTDLNANPDADNFQTNLIMPEPTIFLNKKFPAVSIIRPTETEGAAMGAVQSFIDDGLFIGQSSAFYRTLKELAREADAARRER